MFLSGSRDRTIRLWDLRSPLCQGLMKTNGTPIGAFDPAGLIFGKKIARSPIYFGPFELFVRKRRGPSEK